MGRRDNLIVSKANYSLRKNHLRTTDGVIIENDHSTIMPMEGFFSPDEYAFPESIFKFKIAGGGNPRRKHARGNWEKDKSEQEFWTLNSVSEAPITEETKIVLKPNYSSLSDFAMYGSAHDLVNGSINDIASKYPGTIMLTEEPYNDVGGKVVSLDAIDGINGNVLYYKVSNGSNLDIDSEIYDPNAVLNPLHCLRTSLGKYDVKGNIETTIKPEDDSWCDGMLIKEVKIGSYTFYVYYKDGKKILLSKQKGDDIVVSPKKETLEAFFDTLDDFERVLLNRDSNPLYKAVFETPINFETGHRFTPKLYIWPTIKDGILDLESAAFKNYLNRLFKLADFHDEYDGDNIWRSLIHTSLKNLDWTFFRNKDGEVDDLSTIDNTRLSMIARVYGRSYDDLWRNANNIKYCNKVSYDQKNNLPDYFITDTNEIEGWEITNVSPTPDNTKTVEIHYYSDAEGSDKCYKHDYTGYEANINFLRRLKLNSGYLKSLRGTRRGIETILKLFGYTDSDYEITEYVAVAKPSEGNSYPTYEKVAQYNELKDTFVGFSEPLAGLPLVQIHPANGSDYVIPWFDKSNDYDGEMYFQMKGGWGYASNSKEIDLPISTIKELDNVYTETLQYLKFAEDIQAMLEFPENQIEEGSVCYVTNISSMSGYTGDDTNNLSHYFILGTKSESTILGLNEETGCWGWKNVKTNEYDGTGTLTDNGKKVLYLESIQNIETGNNPHCGWGKYDNGEEYLDYFRQIFKYSLENDNFSGASDDEIDEIEKIGFNISEITDNVKVHWFEDYTNPERHKLSRTNGSDVNLNTDFYKSLFNNEDSSKTNDEAASYSTINVKHLRIMFKVNSNLVDEKRYFTSVVLPYVIQMIPSTTIFEYGIAEKDASGLLKMNAIPIKDVDMNDVKKIEVDGIVGGIDDASIMLNDIEHNIIID